MSAGHDHGASTANERNLWIVLGLTAAFMLAEIVGGILTKSLALISDAAHMFTDAAALAIALAAVRISKRSSDGAPSDVPDPGRPQPDCKSVIAASRSR